MSLTWRNRINIHRPAKQPISLTFAGFKARERARLIFLNDLCREFHGHPIDGCVSRELIQELLISYVVTADTCMCVGNF